MPRQYKAMDIIFRVLTGIHSINGNRYSEIGVRKALCLYEAIIWTEQCKAHPP